ncbi:hypothetical protein HDU96_008359 [Phlyctochytrium bullatum]|nr:hypothetical protein HDU96_008359 [Phlyctochytrium bullatum]
MEPDIQSKLHFTFASPTPVVDMRHKLIHEITIGLRLLLRATGAEHTQLLSHIAIVNTWRLLHIREQNRGHGSNDFYTRGLLLVTAAIIALIFVKKRRAANPPNQDKDLKVDGNPPTAQPQPPMTNFDVPPTSENAYLPSVPPSAPLSPPSEKSPHALFSELRYPQRPGQPPLRVEQAQPPSISAAPPPSRKKEMDAVVSEKPIIEMDASVSGKPMVLVAPARGQSLGGANIAQQRGGSSMAVSRESEPLSLLASLSSVEVGERLLRIGVGPGLVSALEENNVINGANMLTLTDADLVAMGINEAFSREIVLRAFASIAESERERIERAATASMRGEGLPQYSQ